MISKDTAIFSNFDRRKGNSTTVSSFWDNLMMELRIYRARLAHFCRMLRGNLQIVGHGHGSFHGRSSEAHFTAFRRASPPSGRGTERLVLPVRRGAAAVSPQSKEAVLWPLVHFFGLGSAHIERWEVFVLLGGIWMVNRVLGLLLLSNLGLHGIRGSRLLYCRGIEEVRTQGMIGGWMRVQDNQVARV